MRDLVLNDQRRAFSDQYVNLILTVGKEYIEISSRNPIASLLSITTQELKNVPCILVASKEQRALALPSAVSLCFGESRRSPVTIVHFGRRKIQVIM